MAKWEKIKLSEYYNYRTFFDDKLGLLRNIRINIFLLDKNNKPIDNYYIDNGNENYYRRLGSYYEYNKEYGFIDKFYQIDTNSSNYKDILMYNYSMPSSLEKSQSKIVKQKNMPSKYKIVLQYEEINKSNYYSSTKSLEFYVQNKDEFENYYIWGTSVDFTEDNYIKPRYIDLKKRQKYYYQTKGKCSIIEVYDYPLKDNKLCKIAIDSEGNKIETDVLYGDGNFVCLPYEEPISELEKFNNSLNELKIQPCSLASTNIINVMWQPIEEAVNYIVKLYKYRNVEGFVKVYHLKDFNVDRNEHYISIKDIILAEQIIVVQAEDREGNIIAQSRGINVNNGKPQWW